MAAKSHKRKSSRYRDIAADAAIVAAACMTKDKIAPLFKRSTWS
jgi:hypothetical protein